MSHWHWHSQHCTAWHCLAVFIGWRPGPRLTDLCQKASFGKHFSEVSSFPNVHQCTIESSTQLRRIPTLTMWHNIDNFDIFMLFLAKVDGKAAEQHKFFNVICMFCWYMWGNPHKGNFKSDNMDNFDIFMLFLPK